MIRFFRHRQKHRLTHTAVFSRIRASRMKPASLRWKVPTQVLYGAKDNLTSRAVLEQFKQRTGAHLTIMEEGEHWFHTELQLAVLQEWERAHI